MDTHDRLAIQNQIRFTQQSRAKLRERRAKLKEQIALRKQNAELTQKRSDVLGSAFSGVPETPPNVRKGENTMGSRGYSFARAAALVTRSLQPEQAWVEMQVSQSLQSAMHKCTGFVPARAANRILAPLDPGYLLGNDDVTGIIDQKTALELKSLMLAGAAGGFDPDQARWLSQKYGVADTSKSWTPETQKVGGLNQSWIQQGQGGALVPFPEMGPLIPLLRNKNALMTAGAQVVPLPPQGRISFPRQTSPTTTYHVGEGVKITQSNVGTDQFTLSAKKIGAFIITNNELIRYGGPVVEQMFRNDMTISLGLQLDYDLLQAEGSDTVPQGLIGYPGVTVFTPTTIGTNGNTLVPSDLYSFIGSIMANNGSFEGWIIRPELLYTILGKRGGAAAVGDNGGQFLFDILRDFDSTGKTVYKLGGYTATATANAPANRVKGSGTNLTTLYGGQWSDYRIGIYGAIEIATADQGDNLFPQDQTAVRAILSADGGPWHPGVFGYADTLLPTTVGG